MEEGCRLRKEKEEMKWFLKGAQRRYGMEAKNEHSFGVGVRAWSQYVEK